MILAVAVIFVYYRFFTDSGKFEYRYCQEGIYNIYPRGVIDGGITYYDKTGQIIGTCDSWGVKGQNCKEARERAGVCK